MTQTEYENKKAECWEEHGDSTIAYHAAKEVINFLLRRYCLVEKSKVEEELETSTHNYEAAGGSRPYRQQYFLGHCAAVKALFPEIAKEVEK